MQWILTELKLKPVGSKLGMHDGPLSGILWYHSRLDFLALLERASWFTPFFVYLRRKLLQNPRKYYDYNNFLKLYMAYGYRLEGSIRRYFAKLFTTPNQRLEVLGMFGCMNEDCPKRLHLEELKSTLGDDAISEATLSAEDILLLSEFDKGKLCSR
jgi:hypothetical protein